MNIKKCSNGHYYDLEKYTTCPQCENGGMVSASNAEFSADNYGETAPLGGGFADAGYGGSVTEPVNKNSFVDDIYPNNVTAPVTEGYQPEFNNPNGVEDYSGATEPIFLNKSAGFAPVVGWLVCIDGPERGKDYRIKPGYNFIGREERMDICLRGDGKVSGYRDSAIAYDDESKMFYFGHQNGMNPVKVNGKPVINQIELHEYDIITIGSTKLIFVPLCGDKFDWKTVK